LEPHRVTARGGPPAGEAGLAVPQRVSHDLWPTPIVWASQAQRHVYDLKAVEVDAQLAIVPVYDFRRTLGTAEPEPEVSWVRPTRYLL